MENQENKRLFNKISKDFDMGKRHRICFRQFKNENISSILDIGCLNGAFLNLFHYKIEKYGVDLKQHKDLNKNIIFKQANLEKKIPFESDKFEGIFAGQIIEHLHNTELFVKECNRILKPRGVLVLSTINLSSLYNLIQVIQKKQLYCVDFKENESGHVRYFSIDTIKKILRKNGFKVEKIITLYERFKYLNKMPILKKRGEYMIIKARKIR